MAINDTNQKILKILRSKIKNQKSLMHEFGNEDCFNSILITTHGAILAELTDIESRILEILGEIE